MCLFGLFCKKSGDDYNINPDIIFIENGKIYDTSKSTLVAWDKNIHNVHGIDFDYRMFEAYFLYKSKKGTFFVHRFEDMFLTNKLSTNVKVYNIDQAYKLYQQLANKKIPYEIAFKDLIAEG